MLTHGDSDHLGFAERLGRECGVPVYVHAADATRTRGETTSKPVRGAMRLGSMLRFLAYAIVKRGLRTAHLTSVMEIADGQVLDVPGSRRGRGRIGPLRLSRAAQRHP